MVEPKITLRGLDGTFKGKTWQVKGKGKVGRVDGLEVTIDDTSSAETMQSSSIPAMVGKFRTLAAPMAPS